MIHLFRTFWTWLLNLLSGPPPREIPCGCDNGYGDPEPTCTRCMTTGLMPVSEEEYQAYVRDKNVELAAKRLLKKPTRERREVAYLVGFLDLEARPPTVLRIHIFSSNATGLTMSFGEFAFDIFSADGANFQEAKDNLVKAVKDGQYGYTRWIKPYYIPQEELE